MKLITDMTDDELAAEIHRLANADRRTQEPWERQRLANCRVEQRSRTGEPKAKRAAKQKSSALIDLQLRELQRQLEEVTGEDPELRALMAKIRESL